MENNPDRPTIERIARESVFIDISKRKLLLMFIIFTIMFMGALAWGAYATWSANHDQAVRATRLAQEVREACNKDKVNTTELAELCEKANEVVDKAPASVEVKPGPPGNPGEIGPVGPAGKTPTYSELTEFVRAGISRYCASGRCEGQSVSASRIQKEVASYCAAHDQCRGLTGSNGIDGADGQPGADGQDGQDGKDGLPGKDGVPFTFTFTLGSSTVTCTVTSPEPAVCLVEGDPTSTPTPEATETPIIEVP